MPVLSQPCALVQSPVHKGHKKVFRTESIRQPFQPCAATRSVLLCSLFSAAK
jgi:hypothetical protein